MERIDEDPREPFRAVVREAVAAWNSALDLDAFDLSYVGDCADNDISHENERNEIVWMQRDPAHPIVAGLTHVTLTYGDDQFDDSDSGYESDIEIREPRPGCEFMLTAHEFGRALGLDHTGRLGRGHVRR